LAWFTLGARVRWNGHEPLVTTVAAFGGPVRDAVAYLLGPYLPDEATILVGNVIVWALAGVAILLVAQVGMLYTTWLERKFVARVQDRIGPNRVGPFGLLQPIADMVKILTKEDLTPAAAHRWVFNLGAIMVVPPAILVFTVIPWSRDLIASDLSVGFLFFVAVGSTVVIPMFMAGWGSNNKYAVIGAMRAVAQIVAYEIPMVLSAVGVLLLAGTLSLQSLVHAQGPLGPPEAIYPGVWFIFLQPIAFVIFTLATTAEIERTPFDIPEAESEIIAGYHTEYSGLKFGMFYLGLYFSTIAASAFAASLFLGGWQPPIAALAFVPGWIWLSIKTLFFVVFFMWLRATLPRLRVDQLLAFAWKILVPVSLANLLVAGLVGNYVYGARQAATAGSFATTPWFVLLAFTLANVLLIALMVYLFARWQGLRLKSVLKFAPATEAV
jgi:NADH-quinone oxidoreductase subunit H